MTKIIKAINLDDNIIEDIKYRNLHFKFNFSAWVQKRYIQEFMSIESKQKEIEVHLNKIEKLKKEINSIKEFEKTYRK